MLVQKHITIMNIKFQRLVKDVINFIIIIVFVIEICYSLLISSLLGHCPYHSLAGDI